ncbi:MAG: DUF3078 domain-containing protein [Chitinophagales bacterium]
MKKNLLFLLFSLFLTAAMAQITDTVKVEPAIKKKPKVVLGGDGIYLRDSTWKVGGYFGVTLNQVALYQWAPGGSNSFAFLIGASGYANYKKDKLLWENSLDVKWGMVANGLIRRASLARHNFQKNIDLLALKSNFGYQVTKSLYASAKIGFESQLSRSFDYTLTDTANGGYRRYSVSKFAAPAILTIGPGLTWKPKDYFSLFFSPVEGKMTFVTPDHDGKDTTTLVDGRYTDNFYRDIDETRFGLQRGKMFMGELGLELDLLFQKDIVKNVNWKSHLNVFSAYMNASYNTEMPKYYEAQDSMGIVSISKADRHIPVIKWDNDLVFKINKFLSATLSARFVYQYNAQTPVDKKDARTGEKKPDGITDKDKFGNAILGFNKLQIFEQFGIGLALKF